MGDVFMILDHKNASRNIGESTINMGEQILLKNIRRTDNLSREG